MDNVDVLMWIKLMLILSFADLFELSWKSHKVGFAFYV